MYAVRIRSARPPVSLAWDIDVMQGWGIEISSEGGRERIGGRIRESATEWLPGVSEQVVRICLGPLMDDQAGPVFTDVYPNPFNPVTRIGFFLPHGGEVELDVVDLSGRRVAALVRGSREAGHHSVDWSPRGREGLPVPSGVYLVVLKTGGSTLVRKVLYLK